MNDAQEKRAISGYRLFLCADPITGSGACVSRIEKRFPAFPEDTALFPKSYFRVFKTAYIIQSQRARFKNGMLPSSIIEWAAEI